MQKQCQSCPNLISQSSKNMLGGLYNKIMTVWLIIGLDRKIKCFSNHMAGSPSIYVQRDIPGISNLDVNK